MLNIYTSLIASWNMLICQHWKKCNHWR